MLNLTKYYKTILFGLFQNNINGSENPNGFLEDFGKSENKDTFLKDNSDKLISYLKSLDTDNEGTLSISDKDIMNKFIKDNPDINELFSKLGITDSQLLSGVDLQELLSKLTSYKKEKKETIGVASKDVSVLHNVVNTNIILQSKESLKLGSKGQAVGKLQEFLIKKGFLDGKVDLKFGPKTKQALIDYQKDQGFKIADGVLTVRKSKKGEYFPTMQSILESEGFSPSNISQRVANSEEVLKAGEGANSSIDANIDMLQKSKEFYELLEAREDGGQREDILSDMGSAFGILKEVLGLNKASEYLKKIKNNENILKDPKKVERFNKGYEYLVKDITTRNKSLEMYGFRDVLLVLLAKIPVFDVRLNFSKSLVQSGVDMRRATIFSKWAESGMTQSFEKYEKEVGPTIDTGENVDKDLNKLKGSVTAYITSKYKVESSEINKELIASLRKTDAKLDKLINTYISDRFIADAETLLSGGFNVFEYFFDEKYDKINEMIKVLKGGEIKLTTKNKARKEASSSEAYQDVFLLKNNGKFYLHIGTEYKEFDKKPTKKEIESSILEYNKLSLLTTGEGKKAKSTRKYLPYSIEGKKIIAKAKREGVTPDLTIPERKEAIWKRLNLDESKNEVYLSKEEQLRIADDIIEEFKKQNTKSEDNVFGEGKLDGHLGQVEDRLDYYSMLNKKNSSFLKSAISILESKAGISDDLKQTFGMINFYNSTEDFLNAYVFSSEVESEILKLSSDLSPEEYISKLIELNKNPNIKKAFDAIKSPSKLMEYRLNDLKSRLHTTEANHRVDAGNYKYGARMLTREEFNMPYSELQAEYKRRFDNKTKTQKFEQEFTGTFEDVYTFEKPSTYEEYLEKLLSTTGPDKKDETDGKYWSTMDLHERGLIEAGVLDITGEELKEAIKSRGEALDIESLYEDPEIFINTARQAGYDYDTITTFLDLHNTRGDKKIIHTTVDRAFSFTNKSGENITRKVKYDIYMRPECDNIYVLPNSESIKETINTLKESNAVSILNTPTIPVGLFSLLKLGGGNSGANVNGLGDSNVNQGVAVGNGQNAGGVL